ncbi:MAG TPA: hypothetical protein VGK73_23760, partial [Polyangiaceae bacterium]
MSSQVNPYIGLRPFQSSDSAYFYGRREQTLELLELLHGSRFLGVVGRSGCGKSSLVRAGLVPALEAGFLAGERDAWVVTTLTPGNAPLARLARALLHDRSADEATEQAEAFVHLDVAGQLRWLTKVLEPRLSSTANLLLVIDQFEEVFDPDLLASPAAHAQADDFVALLLALREQVELPIFTVLTMRSDYLGDCDRFAGLPEAMNASRYLVPRLTRDQLRKAIEGPAGVEDTLVQPQLLDHLLNEIGDRPDQLPLFQHALSRTWRAFNDRRAQAPGTPAVIESRDYVKAGTVTSALSEHAKEAMQGMDEELVAKIFKCLTDTDPQQRRRRRVAGIVQISRETGASQVAIEAVLQRFREDERYFVARDPEPTKDGDTRVGLSHESLITAWPQLSRWVDEERADRDELRELVTKSQGFDRTRQPDILRRVLPYATVRDDLLQGRDLAKFKLWGERTRSPTWAERYVPEKAYADALEYLQASERAQQIASLGITTAVVVVMLALTVSTFWSVHSLRQAQAAETTANTERDKAKQALVLVNKADAARIAARRSGLVANARASNDAAEQVALLREYESQEQAGAAPDARMKLMWSEAALAALQAPIAEAILRQDSLVVAALSPGGAHVVTGAADGSVQLWDADRSRPIAELLPATKLAGEPVKLTALVYASGAKEDVLVGGFSDARVRVWKLRAKMDEPPEPPRVVQQGDWVSSVAFGRHGDTEVFAAGARDGKLRVWTSEQSEETMPAARSLQTSSEIAGLAFSPDGKTLAAAVGNRLLLGALRYSSHSAEVVFAADASAHASKDGDITAVAFDAGGRKLAMSAGSVATVFQFRDGRLEAPARFQGHQGTVQSLAVSGDGRQLLTGSWDRTARLWKLDEAHAPRVLSGHDASVVSVRFGPGERLLTASLDGTARIWSTRGRGTPTILETPHRTGKDLSQVRALAASSDTIAAATWQGNVQLWNADGSPTHTLRSNGKPLWSLALNPDASLVVAGALDERAWLWKITRPPGSARAATSEPFKLESPNGGVRAAAFTHDSRHLALGSDRGVVLWKLGEGGSPEGGSTLATPASVAAVAFAPDDRSIAAACADNTIYVWSLDDAAKPAATGPRILRQRSKVAALAWEAGMLVSGSADATARIWRQGSDTPTLLEGHDSAVAALGVEIGGSRIVTGSFDNTARIWDSASGNATAVLRGHEGRIRAALIDARGRVITGSDDGHVRIFGLTKPEQLGDALW